MGAIATVNGIEGLRELQGQKVGPSEWREVTQEMINTFAELSGDDQWIHVDVERAKSGPFGTTIGHGYLTLSLAPIFIFQILKVEGAKLVVNYGLGKVRFPAPVPAGSKVRATAETVDIDDLGGGWFQIVTRFTLEVEGNEKPCFVGDQVGRALVAQD